MMILDPVISGNYIDKGNSERVYKTIRDHILYMKWLPGSAINESSVAQAFGISRTPVREAFLRLISDKLIVSYPQRGSYVSLIDMSLVQEGRFMRKCLEKVVFSEAALSADQDLIINLRRNLYYQKTLSTDSNQFAIDFIRSDNRFHQLIYDSQGKGNIWESILSLESHFTRLRYMELCEKVNVQRVIGQHEDIINALESHRPELITALVDDHLRNVFDIMDDLYAKHPEVFVKESVSKEILYK